MHISYTCRWYNLQNFALIDMGCIVPDLKFSLDSKSSPDLKSSPELKTSPDLKSSLDLKTSPDLKTALPI